MLKIITSIAQYLQRVKAIFRREFYSCNPGGESSQLLLLDYLELLYLSKRFPNLHDDEVIGTQSKPLSLSAMQRQVLDALRSVETEEYRLGDWYLGALYALENPYNPDRISQAAQSLRELLEKLHRVVQDSNVQVYNFPGRRQEIRERFANDKNRYKEVWIDKKIDAKLDKTLRKIDRYLELNQQPTRKEQIQITIRKIDPMADQMGFDIQNWKRDAFHRLWNQLESFAHHRSSSHTDEQKFREYVAILEQLVYDLLAPVTAQDQQEIQSILHRTEHSDADAETMYKLITRRGANYVYFFRCTTDPAWIQFLKEKGFFRDPPDAEYLPDGYVELPFWPELQYLKNVSKDAPQEIIQEIIQIVLQLPAVDNPRVYNDILDIALELDGEQSARLKPKMLEYARLKHQFLSFEFPKLLAHWTAQDQTAAALELAKMLVQFVPDPKAEEKQKQQREIPEDQEWTDSTKDLMASIIIMTILRPVPRFNKNYRKILKESVRPLAEKEPYKVACMLMDATASMIRFGKHQDNLDKSSDHSESWCPRLNRQSRNYRDPRETLVNTLTYACEKVFEQARESIEALDSDLRNQRWDVFRRLRQHLYALYPGEQTRPWIRELVLAYGDYAKREYHYEFQQMIRMACEHFGAELLTEDERTQIFETILSGPSFETIFSGPSKEDFREWVGEQFTETDFEQQRRKFHRQQLRPFATVLFGRYTGYFQELENDETADEITDESYWLFGKSKGGTVTFRSPKSPEELVNLPDEELLDYINEWQDEHSDKDDWLTEINIEALAGAFQTVFKDSIIPNAGRLSFWIENRDNIHRPIYVRAMIDAMQEHVKAKDFGKLDEWFTFCEWVLTHPDPENEEDVGIGRLGDASREHPYWHTSRRAVCDFIEACLQDEVDVPISARERLAGLLDMLCTQSDWRLDQDEPTLLNQDDPLSEAINTTRGSALENLVNFGFWVRRHDDKAEVTEMKAILEKRFGSEAEFPLTLPEYAILGMCFGSIFDLDEQWAVARKSFLFPQNDLPAWREAFGNFLCYSHPNKTVFNHVRDDFEFALKNLDCLRDQENLVGDLTVNLGQHLFKYYIWEVFPLEGTGSLLNGFYQATDSERKHWATLFAYVGRLLENTGKRLDEGVKDRIVAFFEWRLKAVEPSELREFAAWLQAECLEAEWRLNALSKVLDVDKILDETGTLEEGRWDHPVTWLPTDATQSMSALLPMHTPRAVEIFAKLTDAMPRSGRFHIPTDDAKAILKAGFEHDDESVRKNAKHAQDNLLKRGYFSVMD